MPEEEALGARLDRKLGIRRDFLCHGSVTVDNRHTGITYYFLAVHDVEAEGVSSRCTRRSQG